MTRDVVELLGVYDADGGVRGELAYVVGRWRGVAHCSLCDITHTTWRRKRDWDEMVARSPVPLRVAHRNELAPEERRAVADLALPLVVGRSAEGWSLVLSAEQLDGLDGSVADFEAALTTALAGG